MMRTWRAAVSLRVIPFFSGFARATLTAWEKSEVRKVKGLGMAYPGTCVGRHLTLVTGSVGWRGPGGAPSGCRPGTGRRGTGSVINQVLSGELRLANSSTSREPETTVSSFPVSIVICANDCSLV
eukprot:337546-Rhodomonas_salina.1